MCRSCWNKQYQPPLTTCKLCGKVEQNSHADLCHACYMREYLKQKDRPKIICKKCGEYTYHCANGLCNKCYEPPPKPCKLCEQKKPYHGHELCSECYNFIRGNKKKIPDEIRIRFYNSPELQTLAQKLREKKKRNPSSSINIILSPKKLIKITRQTITNFIREGHVYDVENGNGQFALLYFPSEAVIRWGMDFPSFQKTRVCNELITLVLEVIHKNHSVNIPTLIAVALYNKNLGTQAAIANSMKISVPTLRKWMKIFSDN